MTDMSRTQNDQLFTVAKELRKALEDMRYNDECDLDHNGSCQAHNYFGEGECPHARAAKLIVESDAILGEEPNEDDVFNLSGEGLIAALNEAQEKGHYKGWTFSEISRGTSVLPVAVYDDKKEGFPITKHQCVSMTSMSKGKIVGITVATTTSDGTKYHEYVPA